MGPRCRIAHHAALHPDVPEAGLPRHVLARQPLQRPHLCRPLQNLGVEVIYGPQYVGGFEAWYRDNADDVGYVFLSRPQIAEKYIDAIDRRKSKILFYGHDLHWRRLEIQWNVSRTRRSTRR